MIRALPIMTLLLKNLYNLTQHEGDIDASSI